VRTLPAKSLLLALIGLFACVRPSNAQLPPEVDILPAGPDLLKTLPGTFFVLNGPGGPVTVPLHGVPDAMGADTIIQRLMDISIPDVIGQQETINAQITELNLASDPGAGPGGSTVQINLTPSIQSLGMLLLTQTINGEGVPEGTFTSFFDVFFDVRLLGPTGGPVPCDANLDLVCSEQLTLSGNGFWTDDIPGSLLVGQVVEQHPGGGQHVADPIPEPGTRVLFEAGLGLAAISLISRRRRR
jgi:hypothetical protein